jgi:hypothetical protein
MVYRLFASRKTVVEPTSFAIPATSRYSFPPFIGYPICPPFVKFFRRPELCLLRSSPLAAIGPLHLMDFGGWVNTR